MQTNWYNKPYYSLNAYCKNTFGQKLYKIALNTSLGCPNRDGTLSTGGCIFCSAGGSGDFAVNTKNYPSVREQLAAGLSLFHTKNTGSRYIAYFQAYTNTYGPVSYLEKIFSQALSEDVIAGISIATRPDCMQDDIVTMLVNIKKKNPDKFVWIELGLQTIHQKTADFINRGYTLDVYDNCVTRLKQNDIFVITHIILGLPGEQTSDVLATIDHLNQIGTWGIKLQLLHVLKGTRLATLYEDGYYSPMEKEAYLELTAECIGHLSPDIVIHRLTGDGPKSLLLAPLWSLDKKSVLGGLQRLLEQKQITQGCLIRKDTSIS